MIQKVVIKRFKQFQMLELELGGHIVLAGQNNSGKTTVLQALMAWSVAYGEWRALNSHSKPHGAYAKKPISRQGFAALPLRAFDLLWHNRDYRGVVEVEVFLDDGWHLAMEFSADSSEQIYVRPTKDTPWDRTRRAGPDVVYTSSVDGLEPEEPHFNNPAWIRTMLSRQRPGGILRNLLFAVSQHRDDATSAGAPSEDGNTRWGRLCDSTERLFGVRLRVPTITTTGTVICEYDHPGSTKPLDLMSAGSGMHQVVLLLATLYSHNDNAVLLVDEPDAHLHVFLQEAIFSELQAVAQQRKSQLILATHSEVMFRSIAPNHLVVMTMPPRRLATSEDRNRLATAMRVLEQVDLINARLARGVLYLEGHTDLALLTAWARVLKHPLAEWFDRTPFWKPIPWTRDVAMSAERDTNRVPPASGIRGVGAKEHFDALGIFDPTITGVWLQDGDGKGAGHPRTVVRSGGLNVLWWSRYETESYLVHPGALSRFLQSQTSTSGDEAVRIVLRNTLGAEETAERFWNNPHDETDRVIRLVLGNTKARTEILGEILVKAGILDMDYTQFDRIAAQMLPEEIHPEVIEKLDFIAEAFGL